MNNVFEALRSSQTKFIFSSSQMAKMYHSSYGNLKLIGERLTKSLGGISVRFWNVYGTEVIGEKSHVISDFINSAKMNGSILMRTDGSEIRDFLHVEDASRAILALADNYDELRSMTLDVASFKYTSIIEIAETISRDFNVPVTPGTGTDLVQIGHRVDPSTEVLKYWQPQINLTEGILRVSGQEANSIPDAP
jgi:UDP-glucose 4-epimerase